MSALINLKTPIPKEELLNLRIGDKVLLSGKVFSARDRAHKFLLENEFPLIKNSIIYHCGPIIKDNKVIAAGPTTSSRMNIFTPKLIEKYGIQAIIGKGGMNNDVRSALKNRAVYFSAFGGAAVIYANSMVVKNVHKSEFGMTEAIWEFEFKDFPLIVTMDSKGNSLFDKISENSKAILQNLMNLPKNNHQN